MNDEPDCCQSCIGTGIGWNGPASTCGCCNGTGSLPSAPRVVDEDRWAFNHFEPEPGDGEQHG